MGAGASSNNVETHSTNVVAVQAKKLKCLSDENDRLKKELESIKKNGGVIRPSMATQKASGEDSNEHSNSGPKVRRGEVSAEARNQNKEAEFNMKKYKPVIVEKKDLDRELISDAIHENILFKNLREIEIQECINAFERVLVTNGENCITQGDHGDAFYVVEKGELEVLVSVNGAPPQQYGSLTKGDSFGELSLMYNAPRAATIHAKSDCALWMISRENFRNIHLYNKIKRKAEFEQYLCNVPELQSLTKQEISRLADAVDEERFESGGVIIREGEKGDAFYIIVQGEVEYHKKGEGVVGAGTSGSYFGQLALLTEEKRAATVTAKSSVTCLTMQRNEFVNLLGSLQELTAREKPVEETTKEPQNNEWHKDYKNIKFEELQRTFPRKNRPGSEREIVLGQGAFGLVQIVKHTETGETYALKCLNKSQIVDNSLEAHVVDERKVMTMLDHPFLLRLYNSYYDDKYVYLLLELCLGGELFTALRKAGRFNEKASKFYAATVLQAFGHLHSKKIVYRDLKPENLMLDDQGYIKVVDFGLAKVVKDRTWTLCGTPDYLAPEIILSKGHDKAVDWWALGILLYEMIAGYVPFYAEDPLDVYQLILDGDLKFPSHFTRSCCDLIRRLLNPFQSKRLGNTKDGINGVVKHRFFSGFDWEGLYAKTITPPIRPKVASCEDTSNFDDYPVERQKVRKCDWVPPFPHAIVNGKTQM